MPQVEILPIYRCHSCYREFVLEDDKVRPICTTCNSIGIEIVDFIVLQEGEKYDYANQKVRL